MSKIHCEKCGGDLEVRAGSTNHPRRLDNLTDQDLPSVNRTWANLWQAKYWQARNDLVNANRGIARLRRRLDAAKAQRDYVAAENDSLLAENRRLAKIISDLEAIRELD